MRVNGKKTGVSLQDSCSALQTIDPNNRSNKRVLKVVNSWGFNSLKRRGLSRKMKCEIFGIAIDYLVRLKDAIKKGGFLVKFERQSKSRN